MSFIPTHYSNRYINQRYNKALYIVQHLPSSSNVQPTKDQKLELYALYKQVSHGDIDTQRPGIFDVVGRAKWDAWKKFQGTSEMEAKHRYVETLLQAAKEAYKKPAGRAQAHQIIQSFAIMQPSGDSGDSSSEDDDEDDDDNDRDEDESSMGSAEAEERAYLRQVQRSTPMMNRRPPPPSQQRARWQEQRSSSRASSQSGRMSMMTAPSELRRLSISSSNSTPLRTVSAASGRSGLDMNKLTGIQQRMASNNKSDLYEDNFDDSVNPWVLHPSTRQYRMDEAPPMQQRDSQQDLSALYRSPMSTTSSSATATQQQYLSLNSQQQQQQQQHEQTVLGPATKRALEALQQEIEALNERINGLRKELVARDTASASKRLTKPTQASNGNEDGWKWVFKVKNDDNGIKE
ncbi:hypothetical protein HMPREF1544_09342 [Mucor circinelloides 1006PhL]|uniref:ACB domain-containing protein n=1 Tax=Mucor circinelloides f. circinelloides (strain 1006PhL) TaxID=1220926 RepID=S2JMX5_MUCC1|nr:hypothetical protein HMPREF1544_09342 [Mucor circinelloides 1006PhL]KAG1106510.1 hypothetical protein G6F42_016725 [Rhizopus arrhizus]